MNPGIIVLVVMFIIFLVALGIWASGRPPKCEYCGERGGLEVLSSEEIDSDPTTVTETLEEKDEDGNVIRTKEVALPGTCHVYHVIKHCKLCDKTWEYGEYNWSSKTVD